MIFRFPPYLIKVRSVFVLFEARNSSFFNLLNRTFAAADGAAPSEATPAEKTERKTQDGRTPLSEACLQKELKKHREADKDGTQTIIVSEKQQCIKSFQDAINISVFARCPALQSVFMSDFTAGTLKSD